MSNIEAPRSRSLSSSVAENPDETEPKKQSTPENRLQINGKTENSHIAGIHLSEGTLGRTRMLAMLDNFRLLAYAVCFAK